MRLTGSLLQAAVAALDLTLPMTHPADAVLRSFFSEHRDLGGNDRAFVAETVFSVLRHRRLLEHLVDHPTPHRLVLAALARLQGYSLGQLEPLLTSEDRKRILQIKEAVTESMPVAVQLSLPDWLYEKLVAQISAERALDIGRAMLAAAPLDLRVNTVLAEREQVLRELRDSGFEASPTPHSPIGLRLTGKPAINRHRLFLSGAIEVQDEGSQILGYLVAPRRREMVVDFCAGAGGKTLMLGALMQSQGRLYALDVSEKRLQNLKPRLKRSGLSNVHPQLIQSENDIKVKRLAGKIDRVLVDAPCSGLGTLRRNPDLKWRQTPESVDELSRKQASILAASAGLLKPGGRLVYATCSLLDEENQAVVEEFLAGNPQFRLGNCAQALQASRIPLDTGQFLQLLPHIHGTDAFFAAILERTH